MPSSAMSDRLVTCRLPPVVSVSFVALSASGALASPRLPAAALSFTVSALTRVFLLPSSRMLPVVEVSVTVPPVPTVARSPTIRSMSLLKLRVFSFGLPTASRMVAVPLSPTTKLKYSEVSSSALAVVPTWRLVIDRPVRITPLLSRYRFPTLVSVSEAVDVRRWVAALPMAPSVLRVMLLADSRLLASLPRMAPPVTVTEMAPVGVLIVPSVAAPPLTVSATDEPEEVMLSTVTAPVWLTVTVPEPLATDNVFAAVFTETLEVMPPALMVTTLPVIVPDVA